MLEADSFEGRREPYNLVIASTSLLLIVIHGTSSFPLLHAANTGPGMIDERSCTGAVAMLDSGDHKAVTCKLWCDLAH